MRTVGSILNAATVALGLALVVSQVALTSTGDDLISGAQAETLGYGEVDR